MVVKVFIGWSGRTSGKIAPILAKWLDSMFDNHIDIVSPTIESDWSELDKEISAADCGLLCVTEDNVNSPRLAYMAGALSEKTLISLLFDIYDWDWTAPSYSMFQAMLFGFDGMRELTRKLNDLLGEDALPAEELERRFPARYPTLGMIVEETLEENEPQRREDWERNELDEISTQLAELTKRVERLKMNVSAANRSRKYYRVSR